MLVLSRKPGEKIVIGENITVTVLESSPHRVRVGIDAPKDVGIFRTELRKRFPECGRSLALLHALPPRAGEIRR